MTEKNKSKEALLAEIEELKLRLEEAEETLNAIRRGEVDAILGSSTAGEVYTLQGAEHPYRVFFEAMHEGGVTMTSAGLILYCNRRFTELVQAPYGEVTGASFLDFVPADARQSVSDLLSHVGEESQSFETSLLVRGGRIVPVNLSASAFTTGDVAAVCVVVTDLSNLALMERLEKTNEELKESKTHLLAANKTLQGSRLASLNLMEDAVIARREAERVNAELERSNQRVNDILTSIQDDFYVLDRDWNFVYASKSFTSKIGKEPKDFFGNNIWKMFPEHRGTVFEENLREAMDKREIRRFEMGGKDANAWYRMTAFPSAEGVTVLGTDITDQKRSEEALGRLAAIISSSEEAIVSKDLDGVIRTWNAGAEKIFGYTAEEAIGRHISLLVPPGHEDEVPGILKRLSQGEHIENFKTLRVKKDGTIIPVSLNFSAIRDASGKIIGASKIAHDITESKRAEEALRASEEQFRRAIEEAPVPVIMHTEDGQVLQISRSWTELTGYALSEVPTLDAWLNKAYGEGADLVRNHMRELFLGSRRTIDIEFPVRTRDGAVRHWSFSASSPGVLSEGRRFVVGMAVDITERKRAEADVMKLSEDMAARNVELEEANRELESFIYSVSHDLRAPLRSVSEFSRIVAEDYTDKLDARGVDYLSRISKGAAKMSRLIEDLLYLSRITRQELVRTVVDMSKVANAIVTELRETNRGRSVEVEIKPGLTASADPRLMEVALSNLLGNAWKFTSRMENARIEFGVVSSESGETGKSASARSLPSKDPTGGTPNSQLVYYIRDNGAGFDQKYAEKMFWPFQRLHTVEEFEGTGIGLTIVERVIRRHGGKVWAEGEPAKGATVYFTLG